MPQVTGIGGIFFRSNDPQALAAWYAEKLGIPVEPSFGGAIFRWQEGGSTVWSAFAEDTDYFGRRTQGFMINYRVDDLDAMLAQLRDAGVAVDDKVQDDGYGRFGWATDPEGNRFELWEPPPGS
jgi:predicted enzyme related to lactoylglutathione lyase